MNHKESFDVTTMRLVLRLALRARGQTSPNPMVGALLAKRGVIIGRGWHHRAGEPHAEIEALRDAEAKGHDPKGATLYVSLEPCCTHGRTPPCTEAIKAARIKKVVVAATDPNPAHSGRGFHALKRAGIKVVTGVLAEEATRLNESFNHWIVGRTPFVIVKAAMSLDGKIATVKGESKWITGEKARGHGMKLRKGVDSILVGVNTVLADDPSLTVRSGEGATVRIQEPKRRFVLDPRGRTPLAAKVVSDEFQEYTTVVVTRRAPKARVKALSRCVSVWIAPERHGKMDLRWLLKKIGAENITSLLVEGGGEVNASFLLGRFVQRIVFFYAPKILGGRNAPKGVGGEGITSLAEMIKLREVEWSRLGPDLLLTARVA